MGFYKLDALKNRPEQASSQRYQAYALKAPSTAGLHEVLLTSWIRFCSCINLKLCVEREKF